MALLCIRNHYLGGVDYERIARLSLDQAASVLAGTRGGNGRSAIGSHFPDGQFDGEAAPGRLTIVSRPDPQLAARNFIMHLVKEDSDPEQIVYVSADMLHDFHGMGADVEINVTEEDFKAVEDTLTRLKAADLRRQAAELEASLEPELETEGNIFAEERGITLDDHSPQTIEAICAKDPSEIKHALKEAYGDRVSFESSMEQEFGRGNFTVTVDGSSVLAGAYDNYGTTSSMKYDVGQMFTHSRKSKLEFILETIWDTTRAGHRPEDLVEEKMSALDSLEI
jgi:hypothetical protein